MGYFVYKLIAPGTTFALDMTEAESQLMSKHGKYLDRIGEQGCLRPYSKSK